MLSTDPPVEILECIGKGSSGAVHRAILTDLGLSGGSPARAEVVALKVVDLEALGDGGVEGVVEEVGVLARAYCPQLCAYRGAWVVGHQLWVAMELLEGGSLASILSSEQPMPERVAAQVLRELLLGLDYLHTGQLGKPTIHRDLKAANVLMSCEGCVKLADFGAAAQLSATRGQRDTFVGSPFWMAPEVITRSAYGAAADVWSLGCVAWELLCGAPPLAHVLPVRALFMIPEDEPPTLPTKGNDGVTFSAEIRDFVRACLQKDPSARPSASDLLSHEIFRRLEDANDAQDEDAVESSHRDDQKRPPSTTELDDIFHSDEKLALCSGDVLDRDIRRSTGRIESRIVNDTIHNVDNGSNGSTRDKGSSFDGVGQPISWLRDAIIRRKAAGNGSSEQREIELKDSLEETVLNHHAQSSLKHEKMLSQPSMFDVSGSGHAENCGSLSGSASCSSSSSASAFRTPRDVDEGGWDFTADNSSTALSANNIATNRLQTSVATQLSNPLAERSTVMSLPPIPFVFPAPKPPGATPAKAFMFPEPRIIGHNGSVVKSTTNVRAPPSPHLTNVALPALAAVQRSVEDGDDASRAALARLEGALAAVDAASPGGSLLESVLEALHSQGARTLKANASSGVMI